MSKSKKSELRYSFFPRDVLRKKDGAIAAWFAISLPFIVGFAALAIDMSYGFTMRNHAQSCGELRGAGRRRHAA